MILFIDGNVILFLGEIEAEVWRKEEGIDAGFFIEIASPTAFARVLKTTDRELPMPDLWYVRNPLIPQVDCIIREQIGNYLYADGSKTEGPCGLSTGSGELTFSDLGGVTIGSYSGTATPSILGNDINITAGTLYDLKLSDGTWIPNPADGYDISGNNNHATPSNLTESVQDTLNTLQDLGFTAVIQNEFDPIVRVPYDVYRKPIYSPIGGEFSVLEYIPGAYALDDGGKFDFNHTRNKYMLYVEENPDVYLEDPGSWTLGTGVSINNNKIIVDGSQISETYAWINANSYLYNADNRKFEVCYNVIARTAGQHKCNVGGYVSLSYSVNTGPRFGEVVVSDPSSNDRIQYIFDADFVGEVKLLSLREIIREPTRYHLDDELLTNANFEAGFTNGLANGWDKYESDNNFEEETSIVHYAGSAQKIIATDDAQDLGIEQTINVDALYMNHYIWIFCSRTFNGIRLELTDNYDRVFTVPARSWTKIYWNSYPEEVGSKIIRIYLNPTEVLRGDFIVVDNCSFRQPTLNPSFLHMFNKNAVVGNEHNFSEVYSSEIRIGNENYDTLNPYKWAFEELNQDYLNIYLQADYKNKLFMKLIKNNSGDVIALKNIIAYRNQLTGMDLKRIKRYEGY